MSKPAHPDYPIHELLARRWSPRAFDQRSVPSDAIDRIFEAARWAASSFNEQPWRYILGVKSEDPAQFERVFSVLSPFNGWAKSVPVLALSIAKTSFTESGKPNRVAIHDVGAASANLTVQATAEGLVVHQMAGIDVEKAKSVFAIPDGYEPVAAIAIGYEGDPNTLDATLVERELAPRKRKPQSEWLFRNQFGSFGGAPPS